MGGAYAAYGAIGAIHLGGYLAGTVAAARLTHNRARLPGIVVLAQAVIALALWWSAAARGLAVLAAARALVGFASGIGIAAVVTDSLERVAPAQRGAASAIAWAGIGIGLAVSAPAGAWTIAEPSRWREATMWCALIAAATSAVALTLRPYVPAGDRTRAERPFAWRDLLTRRYRAFVGAYTCYGLAYISYATFAVAAFASRGIAGSALTAIWVGYGVAAAAGALAIGRVLSGPHHRLAMAIPLAAGAAGALLSGLPGIAAAIAGAVVVGAGVAAVPGVASAFARDRSDAATSAQAFAAVTVCFGLGQLAGPLISGGFADVFGPAAAAWFAAVLYAAGTMLAARDAAHVRAAAA